MKFTEEQLLKDGWKKETLQIQIDEFNKVYEHGAQRLAYDLDDTFTEDQIQNLLAFANKVNSMFLNTRISFRGTGYIKSE